MYWNCLWWDVSHHRWCPGRAEIRYCCPGGGAGGPSANQCPAVMGGRGLEGDCGTSLPMRALSWTGSDRSARTHTRMLVRWNSFIRSFSTPRQWIRSLSWETRGVRWECALVRMPVHYTHIHICGRFRVTISLTGMFLDGGRKTENMEETNTDLHRESRPPPRTLQWYANLQTQPLFIYTHLDTFPKLLKWCFYMCIPEDSWSPWMWTVTWSCHISTLVVLSLLNFIAI